MPGLRLAKVLGVARLALLVGLALAAGPRVETGTQEATPAIRAGEFLPPLPCTVEPRPRSEVEALLAAARAATPAAGTSDGRSTSPSEADLPAGPPPDAATVAEIVALEREWAGCFNAFDLPRLWALAIRGIIAPPPASPKEVAAAYAAVGSPAAFGPDVGPGEVPTVIAVLVRDARVLPDGRVGAVVEIAVFDDPKRDVKFMLDEESFHVYARFDDRWLLDESVSIGGRRA